MATNGRNLANLLGTSTTIPEEKLSADIPLGVEQYNTPDALPLSGNQIGDQAFVGANNRLYIWSGSGWYSVALINTSPAFDSGGSPEAEYVLDSIGGTATTITLLATDPEGVPIQYSAIVGDSGNDLATITQTDNTFVIAARSLDSIIANGYDSTGGVFNVTFRASDGVNLATALSEFTLAFVPPYTYQGSNFGYTSGGVNPTAPTPNRLNVIDKFPFASNANATDVGNLVGGRYNAAGQSSQDNGYVSGGSPPLTTIIQKFPFASDANASQIGTLIIARHQSAGQSSSTHGYTSGGSPQPTSGNVIDKFPFASDANASDVGDLSISRYGPVGQNSSENGYTSGGFTPPYTNVIDKFPFASDANASDVGDLTQAKYYMGGGQSSTVSGYTTGGQTGAGYSNVIDKFPFSSDGNATDAGDLTGPRTFGAGQQY